MTCANVDEVQTSSMACDCGGQSQKSSIARLVDFSIALSLML